MANKQILNELWLHAYEIDDKVDVVLSAIQKSIKTATVDTIIKDHIYLYKNTTPLTVFDISLMLNYYVYNAKNEQSLSKYINELYAENGVSDTLDTLVLTIYTIKGHSVDDINKRIISHELEHLLQASYGIRNNPDFRGIINNAYTKAQSVIRDTEGTYSQVEKNIAWLYYFSNPREQDAFMHEYYNDIIHKGITNDTPIHSILKQYESWIRWYNVNKDEPSVRYALQSYRNREMPKKSFDTMITKGLARFKKKMHNVEKVVTTRRKVVKEARNYGTSITFPPYDQRIIIN